MKNYSDAIAALKSGKTVSRLGWNGKNQFIFLKKGSFDFTRLGSEESNPSIQIGSVSISLFEKGDTGTTTRLSTICFQKASGSIVEG